MWNAYEMKKDEEINECRGSCEKDKESGEGSGGIRPEQCKYHNSCFEAKLFFIYKSNRYSTLNRTKNTMQNLPS